MAAIVARTVKTAARSTMLRRIANRFREGRKQQIICEINYKRDLIDALGRAGPIA